MNGKFNAALCAEARGLLGWTTRILAERAGVSWYAVICFEYSTCECMPGITTALRRVLEQAGVEFIPENGDKSGVRLKTVGVFV
jgi:hypothetical protein